MGRLNQRWEIDSTKGDVMLSDGKRHNVVAIIDVYSRRVVYHISRSSSSTAVAACLRKAILAWGVPEELVTDNGSDYVSRHITDALLGLGITQRIRPAVHPRGQAAHRAQFQDFFHDLVELLDGYIGHDVAGRKDIEARKSFAQRLGTSGESVAVNMSPEDFQAICDRWAEDIYARDPHEGLGGKSPLKVAADWRLPVSRPDERALDVLLSPLAGKDGWYTVRKKGVKIDTRWHIHAALGPVIGQRVRCYLDESDVGAVYVFAEAASGEAEFVCRAVDPETTGISRQEIAAAAKAAQKAAIAEKTAERRAASKRQAPRTSPSRSCTTRRPRLANDRVAAPRSPTKPPCCARPGRRPGSRTRPHPDPPPRPNRRPGRRWPRTCGRRLRCINCRSRRASGTRGGVELDAAIQAGAAVSQKYRKWWKATAGHRKFSAQAMLREMVPGQAAGAGH